jgi:hypothetical protein
LGANDRPDFKKLYDVRVDRTIMTKLIEFYVRDLFPIKARSGPGGRGGEVIEFPKDKAVAAGNTAKIRERAEGDPMAASWSN